MEDSEEQAIQAELDTLSRHIEIILNRIKDLDPVNREELSENKN